ncbi:MAG: SDR family oxidoreductase [Candidatus Hydrogenedentota bacterium]
MSNLNGKVIVITGASEGIGRALALELAPLGAKLVLAARSRERLDELALRCQEIGSEAHVIPTDVTDVDQCAALVDGTIAKFDSLDVLVNNVGGTMWSLFEEVESPEIFEDLMRLNYLSGVWCTYYALDYLRQSKGLIVGISSVAGMLGVPTRTGYAATKHAQFGFFDSLRIELDGTGVDVMMVAPDFVKTQIHRRALKGDGTPLGETPLDEKQIMSPEQCAELIVAGMEKRKRLVIGSARGQFGRWIRLIAPKWMDNVAKKAIASGH